MKVAGVQLDFGAIGKGYALEVAAAYLQKFGVRNMLLSAGTSTILALGGGPDGFGWKVAIRSPLDDGQVLGSIVLRDEAVSTSAS